MFGGNRDGVGEAVKVAIRRIDKTDVAIGNRSGRLFETNDILPHRPRQEVGIDGGPAEEKYDVEHPPARIEPNPHHNNEGQSDRYADKERKKETTLHELPLWCGCQLPVLRCQLRVPTSVGVA